jgi:hypothetical protein
MLPVKSLFSGVLLSYKTVFLHYRKWCKNGDWEHCWISLLSKNKSQLDLSSGDIDGAIQQRSAEVKRLLIREEKRERRPILFI